MIEAKSAAAGRGVAWLLEGFDYFKKAPGMWVGVTLILFVLSIVSSIIPLGSLIFQLIMPVFFGGLILGCRDVDSGKEFGIEHLFAGFSSNAGQLVIVGILYLAGLIIILILLLVLALTAFDGMEFIKAMVSGDITAMQQIQINPLSMLLLTLIGAALYIPIIMAFWFAPALVVLQGQSAVDAMRASFKGCLQNVIPFLIYGVVALVLGIVASIPLLLGWLILIPMITASIYISYKDIFPVGIIQT